MRRRFSEYTNAAGRQLSRMLYDHESDPGENVNVAEIHKTIVADLTEQLHELMGRDGELGDSSSSKR